MPLRPDEVSIAENGIDLRLKTNVSAIDARSRARSRSPMESKFHTTGCCSQPAPNRFACRFPVSTSRMCARLRTLADCRAIIARAGTARRVVVIGASFIGLEVAASLRARVIEVHVVAPEKIPMEHILGPPDGQVRACAARGSMASFFISEDAATAIDGKQMKLSGGALEADLVVAGVGVRPRIALAEKAGLTIDRGVAVNAFLETSDPSILAAGDIARWPDSHSGEAIRVEHWVVAERQGQAAALTLLGQREKFTAVPFFWSQHYDAPERKNPGHRGSPSRRRVRSGRLSNRRHIESPGWAAPIWSGSGRTCRQPRRLIAGHAMCHVGVEISLAAASSRNCRAPNPPDWR